jgi:hypothetical protein
VVSPTPEELTKASAALAIERGQRLQHVADQDQRGLGEEGIDDGGLEVRLQQHVGLVDGLPAGDRRTVEHRAFVQEVVIDHHQVERDVLPLTLGVREAHVHILHFLVLDQLQDVGSSRLLVGHNFSLPFVDAVPPPPERLSVLC